MKWNETHEEILKAAKDYGGTVEAVDRNPQPPPGMAFDAAPAFDYVIQFMNTAAATGFFTSLPIAVVTYLIKRKRSFIIKVGKTRLTLAQGKTAEDAVKQVLDELRR
jgi:hypothetical protein